MSSVGEACLDDEASSITSWEAEDGQLRWHWRNLKVSMLMRHDAGRLRLRVYLILTCRISLMKSTRANCCYSADVKINRPHCLHSMPFRLISGILMYSIGGVWAFDQHHHLRMMDFIQGFMAYAWLDNRWGIGLMNQES